MPGGKWIIGLGNPGRVYVGTRHNIGFSVAIRLAKQWGIPLEKRLCHARVAEGRLRGQPVGIALPQTMMNNSGRTVGCLVERLAVNPSNLLIICDDVALPLGLIRLREQGSDGGHHGLASIVAVLGTDRVSRLRMGIRRGKPGKELTGFVLGKFQASEESLVERAVLSAVEACEIWATDGILKAMNLFNRKAVSV